MNKNRSIALSIAGFDPSGGAGILADIKTFESHEITGLGVVSSITYQNDIEFRKVEWLSNQQIIEQVTMLQKRFSFEYLKIGLIENLEMLHHCILQLKSIVPDVKIIWDPILKASAGFQFHTNINQELLVSICKEIYLLTPNLDEALLLGTQKNALQNVQFLSQFCTIYLKGGHQKENKGTDILFQKDGKQVVFPNQVEDAFEKHGSGCVLSAAITANLAKGFPLKEACLNAKNYISSYLKSSESLMGSHTMEKEWN